ncbi:hypothetical protein [Phorcysia thermohydrogeniphila]|uniref:Uncharacterized protein n=1 Tax=Phorcysia thermohydrogeniphila TaxID=936138 RepID=A0A4R1GEX3_9BACT|nr:hypothetical protein [Phorcysia thermohydrogeniphila]TCK05155.1 hypothetical protein CLV27_0574 [Phorcysia thermohydrogeniphila]
MSVKRELILILTGFLCLLEFLFPPKLRALPAGNYISWGFGPIWEKFKIDTKYPLKVDALLLLIEVLITMFIGYAVYLYAKKRSRNSSDLS